MERRSYRRAGCAIPDDSTVPLPAVEVVDIERPTLGAGEDVGRVETSDEGVERLERGSCERDLTP
jgi:hypothetical protein